MPFDVDFDTIIKLLSPILVGVIGAFVKRWVEGQPRLILYLVHASEHPLPTPVQQPPAPQLEGPASAEQAPASPPPPASTGPRMAHSHAIVVKNTGKRSAKNVRIDHEIFPFSYRLTPPVNHTVNYGQDGSAEILIPVLVPNEQVTVSYLYFPPLTWHRINAWVKSDEGMAKNVQTIAMASPPRAVIWSVWFAAFVGASTMVYWLLRLLPIVLQ